MTTRDRLIEIADAVEKFYEDANLKLASIDSPAEYVAWIIANELPEPERPAIIKALPPVLDSDLGKAVGQIREAAARLPE